jgi:hypothetical protein
MRLQIFVEAVALMTLSLLRSWLQQLSLLTFARLAAQMTWLLPVRRLTFVKARVQTTWSLLRS